MRKTITLLVMLLLLSPMASMAQSVTIPATEGDGICQFSTLDLTKITCFDDAGKTKVRANKSTLGEGIIVADTLYLGGVGTHAPSKAVIEVNGATRFVTKLGVDDAADLLPNHGIVNYVFTTYTDEVATVVKEGTINRTDAATLHIEIDLSGCDYLVLDLQTGSHAWADHVSYCNAYFEYSGEAPATILESDMYQDESKIIDLPTEGENGAAIIPLGSLEIAKATCGWGTIKADKSIDGNHITLKDTVYTSGVGTHATSKIIVKLNGAVTRFVSRLGVDDEVLAECLSSNNFGVVDYKITLQGEMGAQFVPMEGTIRATDATTTLIDISCVGWKYLILEATEGAGGDACDHVDWANAYFEYVEQNSTPPVIVSEEEISSKIACAKTVFSQPGVRFMHRLRAAGSEATLNVKGLPAGLEYNAERELVTGIIEQEGVYNYIIEVTNGDEVSEETVTLTVSSNLQQPVPFMGWLSWNVVQDEISEQVVKSVADAFISQGLYDAGYKYLVIDDLWHANAREAGTNKPVPDSNKFPNGIKAAADYVHSKGLKFGIYSDGGSHTCAGMFGSYGYESIDAKAYAEWGVDLLKYDYCFAPDDFETCKKRYTDMGNALKASGRDILFYICEWGVREPWLWGSEAGGTAWRCTYDTRDGWNGKNGGIGVLQSIAGMKDLWAYSGPNRYNDADMMCVGIHGTGKSSSDLVAGTPGMTQTEYKTQFALWCMWASPLTLSFDLRKPITAEDLAIMTNEEIIAIDQDRMGQQAELVEETATTFLFVKDLENGDLAIAVTNTGASQTSYTIDFNKILAMEEGEEYIFRDLWLKEEVGTFSGSYTIDVASHETKIYRVAKKNGGTSIENIALDNVNAKVADGSIILSGTEGMPKRVLVSTPTGQVVANANGTGEKIALPKELPSGVYIVNIVCNAQSKSIKVIL